MTDAGATWAALLGVMLSVLARDWTAVIPWLLVAYLAHGASRSPRQGPEGTGSEANHPASRQEDSTWNAQHDPQDGWKPVGQAKSDGSTIYRRIRRT